MTDITVRGRINFSHKENQCYNRDFTAVLQDSVAFEYGNKTCVVITFGTMANGKQAEPILLDTRYDKTIKRAEDEFKEWIQKFFENNYNQHTLTFY